MKRKRVLLVTCVFDPEPVVGAMISGDLATALSKEFDVTVLRPKPSRPLGFEMPNKEDETYKEYRVFTLNSFICPGSSLVGRFKECISFGKAVAKFIDNQEGKFDFIYNAAWPMFGKLYVLQAARKYNIPCMSTVQDIYPESISSKLPKLPGIKSLLKSFLLPIDRKILRNSIKIHTISDKMADYLSQSRGVDRSNFVVVRNWQDEMLFGLPDPIVKNRDNPFTFMYLGNIGPLAGLGTLIDAVKMIENSNQVFRLIIAGSGSAKNLLKNKVKEYGLSNIEFWDVPSGMVASTQAKADIMLLPIAKGYAASSIPSKLPAYMFSARPIIACVDEGSDTAMCINDSHCGWVIEPENPEILSRTMLIALNTSNKELSSKGMMGRKFALNNLAKSNNLSLLLNSIKNIITTHD